MKSLDEYPISKYFGEYFLSEIGDSTDYKFSKYYQYSRKTSDMFLEGFRYLQYQDLLSWSYRIKNCASNLWFTSISDGMKLKRANFCRVRYCPMCSYRRSKINRARLFQVWSKISNKYRFLFLTLTVKNVPLNIFRDVYQKQFRSGFLRFRKNLFYNNSSIKGFIRSTEITQPKDPNYTHPHIHMLIAVDEDYFDSHNYMDVSYWAKMWKEALRLDYDPITYISAVSEDGGRSLLEVTKYELKPVNYTDNAIWLSKLALQTTKLRFLSYAGIFNEIKFINESETDLVHSNKQASNESKNVKEYLFNWNSKFQQYTLTA